jgi:hypothetical protein
LSLSPLSNIKSPNVHWAVNCDGTIHCPVEVQLAGKMNMINRSLWYIAQCIMTYADRVADEHRKKVAEAKALEKQQNADSSLTPEEKAKNATTIRTDEFYNGFPYLIAINILDYVIDIEAQAVRRTVELLYTDTHKPATDKLEIHNVQIPLLTHQNYRHESELDRWIGLFKQLRGDLDTTSENAMMIQDAINFPNENAGARQFIDRFNVVGKLPEEVISNMAQTEEAHWFEENITIQDIVDASNKKVLENTRIEIAREMRALGSSLDFIHATTKLPIATLNKCLNIVSEAQ